MTVQFGRYQFDPTRLTLHRDGRQLAVRPRTAALLAALLAQPGQVVTKADLLQRVWAGRVVTEQSLFQAISDLRATLGDADMIVTYPGLGYCLAAPDPAARRINPAWRWAAVLALGVLCSRDGMLPPATSGLFIAPAVRAMTQAVALMEQGQFDEAAEQLQFAVDEDPSLAAARALLAEVLLQQGHRQDSRRVAAQVLDATGATGQSATISALTIMSRVSEAEGDRALSIDWARSAHDAARATPMACAAVATGRRLQQMTGQWPQLAQQVADETATQMAQQSLVATQRCDQWLDSQTSSDDDLGCLPGTTTVDPLLLAGRSASRIS